MLFVYSSIQHAFEIYVIYLGYKYHPNHILYLISLLLYTSDPSGWVTVMFVCIMVFQSEHHDNEVSCLSEQRKTEHKGDFK